MNKLAFIFLVIITLSSCKNENEMRINATITGLKKGTVYLQKISDSTLISLDSVIVNGNDSFSLTTEVKSPELFYIYVDKVDGTDYNDRIQFFGEKGEITFNTHLDKLNEKVIFTGSKSQKVFEQYNKAMKAVNTKLAQTQVELLQAQANGDEELMIEADKQQIKLLKSKYLRAIQFALNNKRSPVAAYIGAREIPEANPKFLDSIYNGLSKKAKTTIYGQELKQLLKQQ
ncbi:DUF4369 domain-containing protein [Pseudofulvibacter geojedonensis]|uniref:DUF4369 domain-containing protein n=1 Tax=Pseudofulvibacter geojedonensis TaxID=1123758 RepID=A0ABW3I0V6_9FLAO